MLDQPVEGATGTTRSHIERAARGHTAGAVKARAQLDVPECPDSLDYLLGWARTLHGRSGLGMNGPSPLSFATIADWSRLTGTAVEPYEVDALLLLDAIMLSPELPKEDRDA